MPEHIQPLPPRTYFAGATVDTSFGTNGVTRFGTSIEQVWPTSEAIFVRSVVGQENALIKLRLDGTIDTTWAHGGMTSLPFETVDAWAYDKRTDKLVVSGHEEAETGRTLALVCRLNAQGSADSTFGTNGLFTYTPPAGSENQSNAATPFSLTLLPHDEVLVGLQLRHFGSTDLSDPDLGSIDFTNEGTTESAVLKLRRSGTRDVDFGRRGIRVVASGHSFSENFDGDVSGNSDTPTIAAITPTMNGDLGVLFGRSRRDFENGETTDASFTVGLTALTNTGDFIAAKTSVWTIQDNKNQNVNHIAAFDPLLIEPTENGALAIGRISQGTATNQPVAAILTPGSKPALRSVKLPGDFTLMSFRPARRGVFAIGHAEAGTELQSAIVRLNDRYRPLDTWGKSGEATVSAGALILDAEGHLLAYKDRQLSRLIVDQSFTGVA